MKKRTMFWLLSCVAVLLGIPAGMAQNNGILCFSEDFTDPVFPQQDWLAAGVTRTTTAGSYESPPGAASFNTYNAELTLPPVNNPVEIIFALGRTTSTADKLMIVEVSSQGNTTGFIPIDTFDHPGTVSGAFQQCTTNLQAYAGLPAVWIRFRKASATTSPWRLDDLEVYNSAPMPVTLANFWGERDEQQGVTLHWKTVSEYQNSLFIAERSREGLTFEPTCSVPGSGTTQAPVVYACRDPDPYSPRTFYRLRQVDFDGAEHLSPVIEIQSGSNVQPDICRLKATKSGVVVELTNPLQEPFTVVIADTRGVVVFRKVYSDDESGTFFCDVKLSEGICVLSVFSSCYKITRKFSVDF